MAALLCACSPAATVLSGHAPAARPSLALARAGVTLVLPQGPESPGRISPAERRASALFQSDSYQLTIRGHDLAQPLTVQVNAAADAATIEVTDIPPGTNRLIILQARSPQGALVPGRVWMAVAPLLETRNRIALNGGSTAVGHVWEKWLDGGATALASGQKPADVLARLDAIKGADKLPHHAFIDTAKWAGAAATAGSIDLGTASFGIEPGAVDVAVEGAPANVLADVWVDDPASPLQSGLSRLTSQSEGRYRITPVLPGQWNVAASVPGLGVATASVTVAAGATAAVKLTFAGWQPGPNLPAPIGNAAAATNGRMIYLVGGVDTKTSTFGGVAVAGEATRSVWVLDTAAANPSWTGLPDLPTAREGAAAGILGNRLIVVGGTSLTTTLTDALSLNLSSTAAGWTALSSPQALISPSCSTSPCPFQTLIGAFDDGGRMGVLWAVFNELRVPPYGAGHAHRLDPTDSQWTKDPSGIPAIRTPRRRAALAQIGSAVAVAGGDRHEIREGVLGPSGRLIFALGTVEAFDLGTRTWATWPDLPTPRSEAAAAATTGTLYVAGGVDAQDHALDIVERFDTTTRSWLPAPALREPRSSFPLVFCAGKLWAIGGSPSRDLNRFEIEIPGGSGLALASVETLPLGGAP